MPSGGCEVSEQRDVPRPNDRTAFRALDTTLRLTPSRQTRDASLLHYAALHRLSAASGRAALREELEGRHQAWNRRATGSRSASRWQQADAVPSAYLARAA